jgi:RNA polymerase sigma-70 factor (ECF subfamily)
MALFEDIYKRYSQDVYRFAYFLSGNQALAEDITSETFVRLWSSDSNKIRILTVKAYLFAIARHLYVDNWRSSSRTVAVDPDLPESGADPEMEAIQKSELEEVFRWLQAIPEVDRTALLMRAQNEMSYEDIARVLGISLAAVKIKIHRARLKLAETRARASLGDKNQGGIQ